MPLVTGIADPLADSYVSLEEAAAYIAAREGFGDDWGSLTEEAQELRLRLAVLFLDNLTAFRGVVATQAQVLAFPRLYPRDALYIAGEAEDEIPFVSWEALTDFAELLGVTSLPIIPTFIKNAQCELAYQVVHSHLLTLNPFDPGDVNVTSVSIGGKIDVALSSATGGGSLGLLTRDSVDALSLVTMYLRPFMQRMRGSLV
jgi:hypothetical protein